MTGIQSPQARTTPIPAKPLKRRGVLLAAFAAGVALLSLPLILLARHGATLDSAKATSDMLQVLRDVGRRRRASGGGSYYTSAPLVADALRRGADPNARYGVTPGSMQANYLWVARHIAGNRVFQDTTLEAHEHRPALMMAVEQDDVEAMHVLLQAGANRMYTPIRPNGGPNGPNPGPGGCQDIVSLATGSRSLEMVRYALSLGGDPNRVDEWGFVPLESSAGSPEVTRLLLAHGANPSIQTHGMPLLTWLHKQQVEMHNWSIQHRRSGWSPEREAAFGQSLALMEAAAAKKTAATAGH